MRSERGDSPPDQIIIETDIETSPTELWRWLREPTLIRRWHGWETEGLAEEIRFIYLDHAIADDEGRTLDIPDAQTRLDVAACPQGARLTVTKPNPSMPAEAEPTFDEVDQGWISFVQQLRFAIQEHPDQERRCSRVESSGAVPGRPRALNVVSDLALGSTYSLDAADRLRGRVWFRTRHQVGLTLDPYDGLLIVILPPDSAPHALVTTYGGSPSAHDVAAKASAHAFLDAGASV